MTEKYSKAMCYTTMHAKAKRVDWTGLDWILLINIEVLKTGIERYLNSMLIADWTGLDWIGLDPTQKHRSAKNQN